MSTNWKNSTVSRAALWQVIVRECVAARSMDEAIAALNDINCWELDFVHHLSISDPEVDDLQK